MLFRSGMESNDFLLGLQTEFQKEIFIKYAKKLVCVDATHGTNAYDFQLITVLVIDDYDEGIPVAWLISNKESSSVLSSFFASIRERCGDVKTEIFMTDDADGYHNSWISAFSRPAKKTPQRTHQRQRTARRGLQRPQKLTK